MLYEVITAWLAGKVADGDGNPLAGIAVSARHPIGIGMAGKTDVDGSYRLGRITSYNVCYTKLLRMPMPIG